MQRDARGAQPHGPSVLGRHWKARSLPDFFPYWPLEPGLGQETQPSPPACMLERGRESARRVKAQGRSAAAAQWADEVRAPHKVAIVQHTAAAGVCLAEAHLRPTAWHGVDGPGVRRGRRLTAAGHQRKVTHACKQSSSTCMVPSGAFQQGPFYSTG